MYYTIQAPTPTAILKKRGSPEVQLRAKATNEPPAIEEDFSCPGWLTVEAQKQWAVLYPRLRHMKVLSLTDENILTAYCQTWAVWKSAILHLQQNGSTYECMNGTQKTAPHVKIAKEALDQVIRMGSKLGLSPSDRAGLHVSDEAEKKDYSKLQLLEK
jgi:P27 family predicted phage terminase small subunit